MQVYIAGRENRASNLIKFIRNLMQMFKEQNTTEAPANVRIELYHLPYSLHYNNCLRGTCPHYYRVRARILRFPAREKWLERSSRSFTCNRPFRTLEEMEKASNQVSTVASLEFLHNFQEIGN